MRAALRIAATAVAVAAAAGALLAAAGVDVVEAGPPHDALDETLDTVAALVRHNAAVVLWPLALVALGWPAIPVARVVGDALTWGQLLLHGAILGSALAQQPGLWRFLPHLPFEVAALAIPVAAWGTARRTGPVTSRGLVAAGLLVVALVTVAALLETYLVPLG